MDFQRRYIFKINNNNVPPGQKLSAYSVGAVILGGTIYITFFYLKDSNVWIPIISLLAGLLLTSFLTTYMLYDRHPLQEEIDLFGDYFISRVYGRIYCKDILYTKCKAAAKGTVMFQVRMNSNSGFTWKLLGPKISSEDRECLTGFKLAFDEAFKVYKSSHETLYPRRYQFTFINEKGYWYALICFLFLPLLLIPGDITDLGFWVLPIIFIPILCGLFLMVKKLVQKEKIMLYADHMVSEKYGEIDFSSVQKIISTDDPTHPALTLQLSGDKEVFWNTPTFGTRTPDSELSLKYAEIWHFTQDVCRLLSQEGASGEVSRPHVATDVKIPTPEIPAKNTAERNRRQRTAPLGTQQVQAHRKTDDMPVLHIKKRKGAYIGISIGAVFLIAMYLRQCGENIRENNSPLVRAERQSEYVQQEALSLLKDFTKKNGPYYLYTNDDSVQVFYYPTKPALAKTPEDQMLEGIRQRYIPGNLKHINERFHAYKELRYAGQYPDSVDWHLTLVNRRMSVFADPSYHNLSDTTSTHVYVVYFTPGVKIRRTPSLQDYAEREGWPDTHSEGGVLAIPINLILSADENLKKSILDQPNRMFALWKEYPGKMDIYLVARQQEGEMTADLFDAVLAQFKLILEKRDIPTQEFKRRTLP